MAFLLKCLNKQDFGNSYCGKLPAALLGHWCIIKIKTLYATAINLQIGGDSNVYESLTEKNMKQFIYTKISYSIVYINKNSKNINVNLYGLSTSKKHIDVSVVLIGKNIAAIYLLINNLKFINSIFSGKIRDLPNRIRSLLKYTAQCDSASLSYKNWISLFDVWTGSKLKELRHGVENTKHLSFGALVFCNDKTSSVTLQATLDSLKSSFSPIKANIFNSDDKTKFDENYLITDYISIIQAGEVVPTHAFLMARQFIASRNFPPLLFADEDRLDSQGHRHSPLFKPEPNHALMLSGTLSRGIWFVRHDIFIKYYNSSAIWAESVRMEMWLRLYEDGLSKNTYRIPYVLTHRRFDTQDTPPLVISKIVSEHLEKNGFNYKINSNQFPVDVQILPKTTEKISIIIPSTCKEIHVIECLTGLLKNTNWNNFEIIIVISQIDPMNIEQINNIKPILEDARVKILHCKVSRFNYSAVNNYAVRHSDSPFICFVNDDVLPISNDWLGALMGCLSDPKVAVVGAKLLYMNKTIQHGGIIMGLSGLCEHAFRHLSSNDQGYSWRATLDQELSAVTGACLLIRREVYEEVGGMDEVLASGFNDVDLCLKVRARGHSIIWSAHAQLFHFESSTFGHHYAGENAHREAIDIGIIWERWHDICKNDPFYNPNLSLLMGSEWCPAVPPRHESLLLSVDKKEFNGNSP